MKKVKNATTCSAAASATRPRLQQPEQGDVRGLADSTLDERPAGVPGSDERGHHHVERRHRDERPQHHVQHEGLMGHRLVLEDGRREQPAESGQRHSLRAYATAATSAAPAAAKSP